ncbi:hypothetical protein Tco_1289623, partial [Tanacetum coccineum]
MTNNINHLRELVDQAWVKHSKDHFRAPTAHDMEILIKTCLMPLALKTHNDSFVFVHELKQEMHADLKYVESLEKEIDELESDKAEFSNMYDMLLQECVSNDVMCSYLHSLSGLDVHTELQCLYLHKVKECECLAQKLSKQTKFFEKKKQEREQYFEVQYLKAKLQDKDISICELKKLIEKCKGKSVETKFDKPSIVRKPNAQRIPKPSVLVTGFKGELQVKSEDRETLFLYCYAFSVSLLLTPLCCDDIHDITPCVSALAGYDRLVSEPMVIENMSPPIRRKYRCSVAFATGCRKIKKSRRCNRKIRIPIAMWPCRVEEKMTLKEVDGQTVEEIETKIIAKDGTITRVPGKFQDYETSKEEPVEQPRRHDMYRFVDHPQLQQGDLMNEFAPHRLPQPKGNINGWLIENEEEV